MNALVSLGNRILNITPGFAWLPPLVARLIVGWVFIQSGSGKLGNLAQVAGFFESVGLSPSLAGFVAVTELVAGILLIAGLGTRLASIPLIITMIVALKAVVGPNLKGFAALLATQELLFIVLLLWLMIAGPGKLALDTLVAAKFRR